ncbi:MAG TPA: extracellular solute-binding protein [Kofleriaceae bacterium]
MRAALLLLAACGTPAPAREPIRFLHTFGAAETEQLNAALAEQGIAVEASLVPFARGQQVIGEILRAGHPCPDLIRIDATWLPGLAASLAPVPPELAGLDWLPEARALATVDGQLRAVPQSLDGLVVFSDARRPAPVSPALGDLVAAARAAQDASHRYPLGLRVDGYWFVPWLRAEGGELSPAGLGGDGATRALGTFAALFGDLAAPPPAAGREAPDELRRWNAGDVVYWVTGPWQVAGLAELAGSHTDLAHVRVTPLAGAPRGGQLLVVPACAAHPDGGWRLAAAIADPAFAARLAALGAIPTRASALAAAPPLVQQLHAALAGATELPRARETPLLFDDLNPALAAVVAKDATADEAIAGVRRGWARIAGRDRSPSARAP